jgi:hypothetical protein
LIGRACSGSRRRCPSGYWSVGLGDLDADQNAESENPAAWALASWMRQRRAGRVELRLRLLGKILRFVRDEPYRRLLLDAVRTYFRLSGRETAEEQQLLQSRTFGEVNEMLQTELGRLEERARREGRREGEEHARQQMQTELGRREERARREGQREGEEHALRSALLEVLQSRFGPVPESVAAQIGNIQDPSTLRDLIGRAAAADSLEDLGALPSP